MRPVFSDAVKDVFMKPYGITEEAVSAILARPEQSQALALEGAGNQVFRMFAGLAEGDARGHVILIVGMNSAEQFQVMMTFKVPPQIAVPAGAMEPPLKMLEGLAELCGIPMVVGEHVAKFITSERIAIPPGFTLHEPALLRSVEQSRLMKFWAVRPFIEAGQAYADCALCFTIEIGAYERALGLATVPPRPDPATHQISVVLDLGARLTMPIAGVSAERVVQTVRQRNSLMLIPGDQPIIHAIRWFDDGQIVFVSGAVTKSRPEGPGIWLDEVRTLLVISLRPDLPGGTFGPQTDVAQVLPLIARSFGVKLQCHPDFGFSLLYSGPWNGQVPLCEGTTEEDTALFSGSFDPVHKTCTCVWAFSLIAYRRWRQSLRMT